jgi:hypothetical protein
MRKKFVVKNPRNAEDRQTLLVVKGDDITSDDALRAFAMMRDPGSGVDIMPNADSRAQLSDAGLVVEDVSTVPVVDATLPALLTVDSESDAFRVVQRRNRMFAGPNNGVAARRTLWVVVDGPVDGQFTVMTVEDAIEGEFTYRWIA